MGKTLTRPDFQGGATVNGTEVIDSSGNIVANITDALASGKIYVGNASGVSAEVTVSGDATLSNTGALTIAADAITTTKLDETTIQYAAVALTNADMLNLRATPITLVAAPGAGKVIEFVSAQLIFDYTGAYTEEDDNMAIRYTNGSGVIVSQAIEATGFVDATADTLTNVLPKIDAIVSAAGSANQALVLHNTGGDEFGGGNAANAVRVKVAYRVHTTGL